MLNVLKAVETVDDDDLKLIVQEQIDEIMINVKMKLSKTYSPTSPLPPPGASGFVTSSWNHTKSLNLSGNTDFSM